MSTRVIAGTAKGLRLKLVPGDSTRPIMDRVKESLFNIIGNDIVDATFLDLFGGMGAVGIEALSRGADHVLFTEINQKALATIHDNLKTTRLTHHATVRHMNAYDLLEQTPEAPFDYIYVAPPQYKAMWQKVLQLIDENPAWLAPHTTIIVQIDPKEKEDVLFRHFRDYDERRYGRTLLWFFESIVDEDE